RVQEEDVAARRPAAGVGGEGTADLVGRADNAQVDAALGDHRQVGGGDDHRSVVGDGGARVEGDRARAGVDNGIEGERAGGADQVDVGGVALDPRGAGGAGVASHGPVREARRVQEEDVAAGGAAGVGGEGAADLVGRAGHAQVDAALGDHRQVGGGD